MNYDLHHCVFVVERAIFENSHTKHNPGIMKIYPTEFLGDCVGELLTVLTATFLFKTSYLTDKYKVIDADKRNVCVIYVYLYVKYI